MPRAGGGDLEAPPRSRSVPEWWSGLGRVEAAGDEVSRYTEAWPDFAYPTRVSTRREHGRVTVSCLLSDIRQEWTLSRDPEGCQVQVRVELPEGEAERLGPVRAEVQASLPRLVAAGERATAAARLRRGASG